LRSSKIDIPRVKTLSLIHDIGDFSIGDYLPQEKAKVNEHREIDYISMMGCYAGLRDLSYIRDLFNEYEAQSTPASRLARELDKMDALIQGHIYAEDFHDPNDFVRFMRDHLGHVHTEKLRRLVERLVP
jgi:5'-deoxynucleotidase YfbR-like HD superfamily hydrolase